MNVRKYGDNTELLWHDRKRYFGLPISFTRYALIRKGDEWFKIFAEIGLLYTQIDEVNLYRIKDISLHQSLGDKIFGTGTVTLYSNDASAPVFSLRHVKDPFRVRELLSNHIEKQRQLRGIRVSELQR